LISISGRFLGGLGLILLDLGGLLALPAGLEPPVLVEGDDEDDAYPQEDLERAVELVGDDHDDGQGDGAGDGQGVHGLVEPGILRVAVLALGLVHDVQDQPGVLHEVEAWDYEDDHVRGQNDDHGQGEAQAEVIAQDVRYVHRVVVEDYRDDDYHHNVEVHRRRGLGQHVSGATGERGEPGVEAVPARG